jgi:hypothetical protein
VEPYSSSRCFFIPSSATSFGSASLRYRTQIGNAVYLIPIVSVIYLLGIVISNVSHLWFQCVEDRLRTQSLKEFDKQYQHDRLRNHLYTSPNAKDLVGEFEFRRKAKFGFVEDGLLIAL